MITLVDSFKIGWFYFARSRGWSASITLSTGLHMEGANKTFTVESPLYKFSDDNNSATPVKKGIS